MIAASHLPLRYIVVGPGVGDPVLYVHGFPVTGAMWGPAAALIEGERAPGRYRHVIPDLRGFGATPAPSDTATIGDFSDDLVHLLSHLREDRPAVVVGLSMGVIVALDLFARYPGGVRALVLVDGRANPDTPEAAATRESMARACLEARSASNFADAIGGRAFAPNAPEALREEWRRVMGATDPIGAAAGARALAGRADMRPTLPAIDVPTLLVCGDHDEITPPALMREMHESIPASRFAVIEGAGHMTPVERPREFADTLAAFLAGLPPL